MASDIDEFKHRVMDEVAILATAEKRTRGNRAPSRCNYPHCGDGGHQECFFLSTCMARVKYVAAT